MSKLMQVPGLGALRVCEAQQVPARRVEIGQRRGHDEAMQVFPEPAVAHFGEAEHLLDGPDGMLDPRLREGRLLARTFDLVRFFARSTSLTTPRWR